MNIIRFAIPVALLSLTALLSVPLALFLAATCFGLRKRDEWVPDSASPATQV